MNHQEHSDEIEVRVVADLLDALRACAEQLRQYISFHHTMQGSCSVEVEEAYDKARAAIARATAMAEYDGPTGEVDMQALRARLFRLEPEFVPSNQYDSGWRDAIAAVREMLDEESGPAAPLTDEDIRHLAGEAVLAMGDVFYDGEAFGDPQVCDACGWEGERGREYLAECPGCGQAIPTPNDRLEEQVIGCVVEAIEEALARQSPETAVTILLEACQTALADCRAALDGEWDRGDEGFQTTAEMLEAAIAEAKALTRPDPALAWPKPLRIETEGEAFLKNGFSKVTALMVSPSYGYPDQAVIEVVNSRGNVTNGFMRVEKRALLELARMIVRGWRVT